MYNIQNGKYYLEHPIYPTDYEGEQNTVYHKLPINILENGKAYKWSATLYWSTSGRYNEDSQIDGSLISVENYFDTRKRPIVGLKNYKEVFSIPFNYVTIKSDIMIPVEDGQMKTIKAGSSVRLINLVVGDPENANIEFVEENDVKFVKLAFTDIYGNQKNMNIVILLIH